MIIPRPGVCKTEWQQDAAADLASKRTRRERDGERVSGDEEMEAEC